MADIIQAYGLFWKKDNVFWGAGSNPGALFGVSARARRGTVIDFRDQIGIYILYQGHRMIYVGQAGSGNRFLFKRLRSHKRDVLAGRWDTFSWFGLRRVLLSGRLSKVNRRATSPLSATLNHMEAVLIAGAEPALNRQGGRFGGSAKRYLQVRDERLGLTDQQMIRDVWEELGKKSNVE